MIVKKLGPSEKLFLSALVNIMLFGGVFALKMLGLATDSILLILATVVSLEVIYFTVFIQLSVNKNTLSLETVTKHIAEIRENEEKAHTALIYTGHQIKLIQHELDTLRKSRIFKNNGNGSRPRVQA